MEKNNRLDKKKKRVYNKNTAVKYHLYCEECEYDWWSENGFEECPFCKGVKNE